MQKKELRNVFAFNFKRILKEKNLSRKDVAEAINIPYTKVCDWSRARTYPNQIALMQIARYLKVSIESLTSEMLLNDEKASTGEVQTVPINIYDVDSSEVIGQELIPIKDFDSSTNQICFYITDDAMSPKYEIGDLILSSSIEDLSNLKEGDYLIKNMMNAYVVRIYPKDDAYLVTPLNPNNSKNLTSRYWDIDDFSVKYNQVFKITRVTKYIK